MLAPQSYETPRPAQPTVPSGRLLSVQALSRLQKPTPPQGHGARTGRRPGKGGKTLHHGNRRQLRGIPEILIPAAPGQPVADLTADALTAGAIRIAIVEL